MAVSAHKIPISSRETLLTSDDLHFFNEGTHSRLYRKLGAHPGRSREGREGAFFGVWAPDAEQVFVVGSFNGWSRTGHPLHPMGNSGIWEGFIPGVAQGDLYKYHIVSRYHSYEIDKSDPFAFYCENPPRTASIVWTLDHPWTDHDWMRERRFRNSLQGPISIYEVHLGSWMRMRMRPLNYRELATTLVNHVCKMGFTHVEFLPVMEHPFYGSWGYQTTGYFAPTSRYGTPQDFMSLIDALHQKGIAVILDWVPSHFPSDEHALGFFDGTHLFEHAERKKGFHPDWKSLIFNYGRKEVQSFLLSSALFWLDHYHADALRLDAVASMLYLDYSRGPDEWMPNAYGGRENLEAIDFLRKLNSEVYHNYPDVQTIAEESTAWPMVSRPAYVGGLGFGLKWDMGWMHDTLEYMKLDPIHRKYHHDHLTFRMMYAFMENFILPLSHDEVVYGKKSLLNRMPGDEWQKFANLRLLYGLMYGEPGKKLLFMGGEIASMKEWNHEEGLDWELLDHPDHHHNGVQQWVQDLNAVYRRESSLFSNDFSPEGFEWMNGHDSEQSVIAFLRKAASNDEMMLIVCNFTPVPRFGYRLGIPRPGLWHEILNSDAREYGGSGLGNLGGVRTTDGPYGGHPQFLDLTLPPLAAVFFKWEPIP